MALDESTNQDLVIEKDSYKVLLDPQISRLVEQTGGLSIEYISEEDRRGFLISMTNSGDCGSGGCSGCG